MRGDAVASRLGESQPTLDAIRADSPTRYPSFLSTAPAPGIMMRLRVAGDLHLFRVHARRTTAPTNCLSPYPRQKSLRTRSCFR
jgi:hypothetical protein